MHSLDIASLDEITEGRNNDKLTELPKQNPASNSHPGSKLIYPVAKMGTTTDRLDPQFQASFK